MKTQLIDRIIENAIQFRDEVVAVIRSKLPDVEISEDELITGGTILGYLNLPQRAVSSLGDAVSFMADLQGERFRRFGYADESTYFWWEVLHNGRPSKSRLEKVARTLTPGSGERYFGVVAGVLREPVLRCIARARSWQVPEGAADSN